MQTTMREKITRQARLYQYILVEPLNGCTIDESIHFRCDVDAKEGELLIIVCVYVGVHVNVVFFC